MAVPRNAMFLYGIVLRYISNFNTSLYVPTSFTHIHSYQTTFYFTSLISRVPSSLKHTTSTVFK
jgi:hypothetical protein